MYPEELNVSIISEEPLKCELYVDARGYGEGTVSGYKFVHTLRPEVAFQRSLGPGHNSLRLFHKSGFSSACNFTAAAE
jgi:hypothetical protein